MCEFIEMLEKIKSSSSESVANKEFSEFNEYMHVPTQVDKELGDIIKKAAEYKKALILVCGNSGDGKSHLISKLVKNGVIDERKFHIYNDATSSDRKGMHANEKLKEILRPFKDGELEDGNTYRLIVAINLGVLNDFLQKNRSEFSVFSSYIENNNLFDTLPAWKSLKIEKEKKLDREEHYLIAHVDFTEYHRYTLSSEGVGTEFIHSLLSKIMGQEEKNHIYRNYVQACSACGTRENCPVYYNYGYLLKNLKIREYIVSILIKAIIKHSLTPSVREINDFFYECIVGSTFDSNLNDVKSVERLNHFIHNNLFWNLFENISGLRTYVLKEDSLNSTQRSYDQKIVLLNLMPSFDMWVEGKASEGNPLFIQIDSNIKYCSNLHVKQYNKLKDEIKRDVFKLYLRAEAAKTDAEDQDYKSFIKYVFNYNTGNLEECEDLYELVQICFYRWNGRLNNEYGEDIKDAVVLSKGSDKYCLYKTITLEPEPDYEMDLINLDYTYWKFSTNICLSFRANGKIDIYSIDIDYDLYTFLLNISRGYQPTSVDRRRRVKFDSFVKDIVSASNDEIHVYSFLDNGRRYVIKKNFIGKYIFEEER